MLKSRLRIFQGHIKDINRPISLGRNLGPVNADAEVHKDRGNFVEHTDMVPGVDSDYR